MEKSEIKRGGGEGRAFKVDNLSLGFHHSTEINKAVLSSCLYIQLNKPENENNQTTGLIC